MSDVATSALQSSHPPQAPTLGWGWRLFAVAAGLFDPIAGIVAGVPGWAMGIGATAHMNTPRRRRRGLVIVLGGIEGPSIHQRRMAEGIMRGGWRGAVVIHTWNAGPPMLRMLTNLMDPAHHERESDRVVQILTEYRRAHPTAPMGILSQSGGCWIAVRALEKAPEDIRLRSLVMLAPALSRGCDIGPAAARCERGIACVGGPGDWLLLGLGTSLLGTSDRRWGPSAGWLGWRTPIAGLTCLRWRPAWIRHGYLGNHTSTAVPSFLARHVAPWFR